LITGTPTTDGTYSFVVRVEDSASPALFDEKQLTIEVSRTWVLKYPTTAPAPRVDHVAAYNSDDGSVLIFGGNDAPAHYDNKTYVWDGMNWQEITPSSSPSPRLDYTLVYAEGKWFLFGGSSGSPAPLGDMWIFDGSDWTQIAQTSPWPSARWTDSQFAYDFHRKKIIIVGGNTAPDSYILDQWEFDVTTQTWQQVSVTNPPAFWMFCVTYDPDRRRLVLFGGRSSSTYRNTTMWFNNGTWEQITTTQSPDPRCEHCQLWEPIHGYIVVFGGYNQSAWLTCDKIWLFDGSDWHSVTATGDIPVFQEGAAWFDYSRGLIYFCCGRDSSWQRYDYMYSLDPVTWEWKKIYPVDHPPARREAAITWYPDLGKIVMFGGATSSVRYGDTWAWDGEKWEQISTNNQPTARCASPLVYDSTRKTLIMYGGYPAPGQWLHDMWEFDGTDWHSLSPAHTPGDVRCHGAAALGNTIVLVGGELPGYQITDRVWIWDGNDWSQGPSMPNAASFLPAAVATNSHDDYLLVFGGYTGSSQVQDCTQKFDGTQWTVPHPQHTPPGRCDHAMTYLEQDRVFVMFGGWNPQQDRLGDFWQFDGTDWQQISPKSLPPPMRGCSITYDPVRKVVVLFGGSPAQDQYSFAVWEY